MPFQTFSIRSPAPLSLRDTVRSHGWVNLAPWHWDDAEGSLSRRDRLPGDVVARVEATQDTPQSVQVAVKASQLDDIGLEHARSLVDRWLSVGWDPGPAIDLARRLDPSIAEFLADGGGRFLRCSTFFEDFAKTLCTIHAPWSATRRMAAALVGEFGEGLFPTPLQILDADETSLKERSRLGFRARVLLEATEELLKRELIDDAGRGVDGEITYEKMIGLRGVGPYAASHLSMLLHDFSRIPIDSEVRRFCNQTHGLAADEIETFFERWGEYRFLGYKLGRIVARAQAEVR